jgi:hypothetical protein
MARIRTVKPEFYRHEKLQDLEIAHAGSYPMFVFEGLWSICDNQGVFEWRPRQIKLDILPFLPFDMSDTLEILVSAGFVEKYEVDGKKYGIIPTLPDHQRFTGKESGEEGRKYPLPIEKETTGKQQGNNGEALEHDQSFPISQEKEKEKEKERKGKDCPVSFENFAQTVSEKWNSLEIKPAFRFTTSLGLTAKEREGFITASSRYSISEIIKAMENYHGIGHSADHEIFPKGYGLAGFLGSGVEKFTDDSGPWERCQKKDSSGDDDFYARMAKEAKEEEEARATRKR